MNASTTETINWDRLCRNISEQNLIPVIGNEMYSFSEQGVQQEADAYFAQELLRKYDCLQTTAHTIAGAVEFLLRERRADIRDINDDLKELATAQNRTFPLLSDFLAIDQLYFYVNTTVYGNILTSMIKSHRGLEVKEGNFSINESFEDCGNIDLLKNPFVFNIFGSVAGNVGPALKEEEMLEFTTALIGKMGDAKFTSILDALKNKTLLFLGCSQPEWLIRFLFRILSNERIDNWQRRRNDIFIVNNASDERETQFSFLKSYHAITYGGNTAEFIKELTDRWSQWRKAHPPKPKNIFISYSHKDRAAAERLFSKLSALENVKCWYDDSDLQSGDNFTNEIIVSIDTADLFIPLISDNSLAGDATYVKREWLTAFNSNVMRAKKGVSERKYLLPIVIDNSDLGNPVIKEYFPSLTIAPVAGGNADEQFINIVKRELELI